MLCAFQVYYYIRSKNNVEDLQCVILSLILSLLLNLQQIATRMVIQYGWGPDDSPAIYYHSNAVFFFLCIQELVMTCVLKI